MGGQREVVVVRLGHRPGRDDRMTTHVGLTSRALGADRFVLVGEDAGPLDRIDDVTDRFGGPFETARASSIGSVVESWEGSIVHLTMYGIPLLDAIDDIRSTTITVSDPLAVIVGAEKVPFGIYEAADWNVAVTNQPHSEVASLAVLLDRLLGDRALEREFDGGDRRVVPQSMGKRVEEVTE